MQFNFRTVIVIAAVSGLAGCRASDQTGRAPVAVTSKITFANGQPVKDVMCCFVPHTALQLPAEFPLDANGNLTKTANGVEPTLLPGKYSVYFQPIERPAAAKNAAAFKRIPTRYQQQADTGLEIEIGSDNREVVLRLDA